MGVVYRARQPRLKREVAVKVILASRFAGESARKRFLAEAELAAQLDHPHIVPIYEVGETPDGPFYAMKLIEGGTLAGWLLNNDSLITDPSNTAKSNQCSVIRVATMLSKIARAVHHAHQRGVLHRDLKPGNILLDAQGEPHITDFGLARQLGVESSLTVTGSSLGTPAYMAPEQARGERAITTASDIWSLGAILYHLLAGRPPFTGESAVEVLRNVIEEEPVPPLKCEPHPRLSHCNSHLSPDLETICLKCLEKDPVRRYLSALAFAEDLERCLNHEPIRARPSTAIERLTKWARRRPAVAALVVALHLAALAGLVGITWQWRRAERNATAERVSSEKARDQLWHSLLAQARAGRTSGQFGSKRAGLEAIATAARLKPSLKLCDEAIAHLALFDLQPDIRPHRKTNGVANPAFDSNVERCVDVDEAAAMLRVFRLSDDVELFHWPLPRGAVNPRFSPQGRHLIVTRGEELFLLDALTGKERFRVQGYTRARFSPDDATLAVNCSDRRVRFYDTTTGRALPQELTAQDNNLAWSPDGRTLVLTDNNKVNLWDWRRGERVERLEHDWTVSGAIAWEGEYLAFGDNLGQIRLWNSRTKQMRRLLGHDDFVERLQLNGTGTVLASVSWDGTTRFWNTATGRLFLTTDSGFAFQFSRDGQRVGYRTATGWGVWQVDASREYRLVSTGDQEINPVSTADLSPDGRALLAAGRWSGIQLVDLLTGRVSKLDSSSARVASFTPDGKTILSSSDKQGVMLRPLELATNHAGELVARLDPPRIVPGLEWKHSDSVSLSDDGLQIGTKVSSREVVILRLSDTNQVTRLFGAREACRPTFSADHRWVVTASEGGGGPCLWEAGTGRLVRLLHEHSGNGGAQFSPDGCVLVTSDPSGVRFYETATWSVVRHLPAELGTVLAGCAAFTPDSHLVAFTTGKRELRLANPRTGEILARLTSPEPRPINSLRFSRDGRMLAVSTSTDAVDLWDIGLLEVELGKLGLSLRR